MAEERTQESGPPTQKNERLQALVNQIAGQYAQASRGVPGQPLESDLQAYAAWLAEVHSLFRDATRQELTLTYASEWVLDNYYIIRQALRQIEEDLPPGYYAQLPKLERGPLKGFPRIYAITRAVLAYEHMLVNTGDLQSILEGVQERVPLTMGELWATPIFLRYGLIEGLVGALELTLANQKLPTLTTHLPERPALPDEYGMEPQANGENGGQNGPTSTNFIANTILSLRFISEQDWNDFFDATSRVEKTLGEDPIGVYPQMDFKSRDLYRKAVEKLSLATGQDENGLAEAALELAREGMHANGHEGSVTERRAHVGYYLIGDGRPALEARVSYHPRGEDAWKRWIYTHASPAYLGSILLLTVLLMILFGLPALRETAHPLILALILVLLTIPALTIATSLVNWLVTELLPPRSLPKIAYREAIPDQFRTLVTIPALITRPDEVDSLVRQIEMHYLRNPEPGLLFALLTDFGDADQPDLPEDEALVQQAQAGIQALNARYARPNGEPPFFFLNRPRVWNPKEGKWMGWERKRGKLHELNLILRGHDHGAFTRTAGDLSLLKGVRFVLTLDADTVLPRGAARRLVGTLAHPLNRAVFDERTGQVVSGYTVLQPRMEISPTSANLSWFTRIFAGDAGLDLYTLAVSDTYQDLFGEGIYVGKGIYDVEAFERSVGSDGASRIESRIPENMLLSHDLLEGLMGRAGLVTDVTMIEDYPPNYFAMALRQRRWIRGDWQLLPWLLFTRIFHLHLAAIDRWKIVDNLRRSLLSPWLLGLFVLGMIWLPGPSWMWLAIILITLGIPLLTSLARGARQTVSGELVTAAFHSARLDVARWLLALAFLPYEGYGAADAILTTLYRLLISRRNLLQWTTAAHVANFFHVENGRHLAWQKLGAASLLALVLGGLIAWLHPAALPAALPLLVLWLVSPLIARWINQPLPQTTHAITPDQAALLRRMARRTWSFFERFVGPEDHWLPPDHYQESPVGTVAHRTSPTNIGLLFNSALAAYDLGYLDSMGLSTRLAATIDTMDHLERYRGHFLNWYDTMTLQPLYPRYVSTVDSGNLCASLIVTAQACKSLPDANVFRREMWQGYLDTLSILKETLAGLHKGAVARPGASKPETHKASGDTLTRPSDTVRQVVEIEQKLNGMTEEIQAALNVPSRWYGLFTTVSGPFWKETSAQLATLIATGRSAFDLDTLRAIQEVAGQVERFQTAVQRTINELVPWIPLLENPPSLPADPSIQEAFTALREALPYSPRLSDIRTHAETARGQIATLRAALDGGPAGSSAAGADMLQIQSTGAEAAPSPETAAVKTGDHLDALDWLDALENAIAHGTAAAGALLSGYAHVAACAEQYVLDMDFHFLYNPLRRIFHIGFNIDSGQLDNNYYDLLASEARIASLIAIALGQVPQSHWLHLSRAITSVDGMRVLLSWSATMFEYLMPPLFLPSYPGTLLAESSTGAVKQQIAYGKTKGVPWGISESGFYRFDASQNYQYRAFGVPGLGFKRGLGDDLVIAPYASLMAVCYNPQAVIRNINDLMHYKALGLWGFYEAIDFTPDRLLVGETSAVVREYMAHHQGMILLALDNFFNDDIMVRRMDSDPRIQSAQLLLQEQVPISSPTQSPYAEDVKGVQRVSTAAAAITAWSVPVLTPIPQMHLLSNGNFSTLISNSGSGYSSWQETDLTRWQPDGVLDPWGTWIYIQEPADDALWSAGFQPAPGDPNHAQVTYFAHMAVFRRRQNAIISTLEVTVAPEDPVEIRRVSLNNSGDQPHHLRLTSYGEVILNQQSADARHPAFNRLFIEEEWLPELNLQIFKRRPRSDDEKVIYMGHMLVVSDDHTPTLAHEADRARFIGRDGSPRRPAGLVGSQFLSGSSGATLDPIFALGQEVDLAPHQTTRLAYLTLAGESREAVISLAERYRSWALIDRTYHQADMAAQTWMGQYNIDTQTLKNVLQVLSALLYPFKATRAASEVIAANHLGQPGLWRFGVSGDYPILMVEVDDPTQLELVREALLIHRYLRSRRFMADVVIINHQQTDYGAELNGILYRLVSRVNSEQWLNQRGGVFILYADQMKAEERTLLKTAARVLLIGQNGSIGQQLPGYSIQVPHLPEFIPTRPPSQETVPAAPAPLQESNPVIEGHQPVIDGAASTPETPAAPSSLQFFNGYGGFSADGKEYVIEIGPGKRTPAPWVNVIGYPQFGFMVTEAGSQCTWAINSGENRLTPWSNDPVRDPTGEALYLRDEETGEVWTPTPLPSGENVPFTVRHGAGYTIFEHESHGLSQQLTLFASPEDPVKFIHLRVRNTWDHPRRITATQYVEWVLGTSHFTSQPYFIPEYDAGRECLLITNPYNTEFAERVGFLSASKGVHGVTADRTEFLGRNGSLSKPAAFGRLGLETRITAGEDVCGVLQLHLDLLPGQSEEIYFALGQGSSRENALALVDKYCQGDCVGSAWDRTQTFWERLLDTVTVRTPQPAVDRMLNRWLLYQALSCRIWGRTAFYQSSGAFGFRDQLQDVLALLPIDPGITRGQILNAAAHQFDAGDVLHWWHPPSGRGVRTRFSDDLLWLPYVTALYVEATGDLDILAEKIPFLIGPPLKEGELERYGQYAQSDESYTLFEHCRRAIEKGATQGPNQLPLIGTGDWNDGLNRVGVGGKGESVWLAWFLIDVLDRFARVCERVSGASTGPAQTPTHPSPVTIPDSQADAYRAQAQAYAQAVEKAAWDGDWYKRAFYDDGSPLGSIRDIECHIDSIAQSWAVLSGAGNPERAKRAMQSTLDKLVRPKDRLALLFTPPFDQTPRDPGYIKGYLPGTRENGGQYTHAATWTAWAFARLGDGKQAGALYDLLNPIFQADNQAMADVYRVEPYVICADIYSVRPYLRRGGWTWYTGSAAWMYRLGLEALLGFNRAGDKLQINPVIPPEWDGFEINYRFGAATYQIQISNPAHVSQGVKETTLDGQRVDAGIVPLNDDGKGHQVKVIMG